MTKGEGAANRLAALATHIEAKDSLVMPTMIAAPGDLDIADAIRLLLAERMALREVLEPFATSFGENHMLDPLDNG